MSKCKSKEFTAKAMHRFLMATIVCLVLAMFIIYVIPMEVARWTLDPAKKDLTIDQLNYSHNIVLGFVFVASLAVGAGLGASKYFKGKKKCSVCTKPEIELDIKVEPIVAPMDLHAAHSVKR